MRGWLLRGLGRAIDLALWLRRSLASSDSNTGRHGKSTEQFVYIHESIGEPYEELGEIGHWYVDPLAQRMYGPKTKEGWPRDYVTLLRSATDRLGRLQRDMTTHYAVERVASERLAGPPAGWCKAPPGGWFYKRYGVD